jgi:hypothetical protein
MNERSEFQQHGAFFAAQRRSGHWRHVDRSTVSAMHDVTVRQ